MKKVLLSMAAAAFVMTGCGKKVDEHSDDTHQHEDGSTHADHEDAATTQEEFNVSADSTATAEPGHEHGEGADHQH